MNLDIPSARGAAGLGERRIVRGTGDRHKQHTGEARSIHDVAFSG
jgi:hypothetical protein